MQIDIATLFPEMCDAVLQESILGRAQKSGAISVQCWNIRDYTLNKHKRVDDVPYGGGRGMVMQADPIYRCWEASVQNESPNRIVFIFLRKAVCSHSKKPLHYRSCRIYFCFAGIMRELISEFWIP